MAADKSLFTYDEALRLLPEVQRITQTAVARINVLAAQSFAIVEDEDRKTFYENEQTNTVNEWVLSIRKLGCDVKGLWLVDFDNGEGYYCWQYPEPNLEFFHGYSEGFAGRTRIF